MKTKKITIAVAINEHGEWAAGALHGRKMSDCEDDALYEIVGDDDDRLIEIVHVVAEIAVPVRVRANPKETPGVVTKRRKVKDHGE